MELTAGAIAGIVVACVVALCILVGIFYYVIKRRRENGEYQDRCHRLWTKYGERSRAESSNMAAFPYADPSFVRAPVPGQQFTRQELDQGFVIPGKGTDSEERQSLLSMQTPINPEELDPSLYNNDGLQAAGDSSRSSGSHPPQVFFSLDYDESSNALKVYIDQAKHLKPTNFTSTCDPYCVVSLLPGERNERQSHVQRRTVDPVFQEEFLFNITKEQIEDSFVQVKFFEYDQFSRHECIGIVLQKLDEVDLKKKVVLWRKLSLTSSGQVTSEKAGDILLRLGYLPSAEKLTVVLLKARSLREGGPEEDKKPPDPYIRVSIFHDGNLLKKKKTSTKKGTCNPVYNQAINFAVPLHVLPQVEIRFSVVHETGVKISRSESKEIIGALEIGPHSSGDEKDHWRDLMSNKPQARWHHLTVKSINDFSPTASANAQK